MRRRTSWWIVAVVIAIATVGSAPAAEIVIRTDATALEQYAARELQRYLYLVTGAKLNISNQAGTASFVLEQDKSVPGPQGYSLKRNGSTVTIAGSDAEGVLYGVYGLLQDHYGIGFYMSGDTLPEAKLPLLPATLDETKKPAVTIRGFLPWTNFPQSDTVYSWEDWKFVIDQAAKMRMNFILVHNYNGEAGHNEPFHNFELNGWMSRVFMPTAKTGHGWFCPGWDVNQYRFGAADLFDDYDFGSDCALHNEALSNKQVFRKGVSLFQKVIAYAHTRGVKVGLGLDINLIPGMGSYFEQFNCTIPGFPKREVYKAKPSDPAVITARANQVAADYPDLDYLICFQSEGLSHYPDKAQGVADDLCRVLSSGQGKSARHPRGRLRLGHYAVDHRPVPARCYLRAHRSLFLQVRHRRQLRQARILGLPVAGAGRREFHVLLPLYLTPLRCDSSMAKARLEHDGLSMPHLADNRCDRPQACLHQQRPLVRRPEICHLARRLSRVRRAPVRCRRRCRHGHHQPE